MPETRVATPDQRKKITIITERESEREILKIKIMGFFLRKDALF